MNKFKIKSKKNMYYSIFFTALLVIYFASSYKGLGFPKESELQYTTGVFNIKKSVKLTNHVKITSTIDNQKSIVFSCAYNPFRGGRASSCGDRDMLTPYVGKEVTIGWYKQKKYLGFDSKLPQLVTIDINNKEERSYAWTANSIKGSNKFLFFIILPLSPFIPFFLYWCYGKQDRNERIAKNQSNS